jgi:hypothetical protein
LRLSVRLAACDRPAVNGEIDRLFPSREIPFDMVSRTGAKESKNVQEKAPQTGGD